jgi:hypothetical protein
MDTRTEQESAEVLTLCQRCRIILNTRDFGTSARKAQEQRDTVRRRDIT